MNVGIHEAKSKLSWLVERAEAGEEIVLTRRGRAIARIVGVTPPSSRDRAALLREIRALSRKVKIPKRISIQELVSDARVESGRQARESSTSRTVRQRAPIE